MFLIDGLFSTRIVLAYRYQTRNNYFHSSLWYYQEVIRTIWRPHQFYLSALVCLQWFSCLKDIGQIKSATLCLSYSASHDSKRSHHHHHLHKHPRPPNPQWSRHGWLKKQNTHPWTKEPKHTPPHTDRSNGGNDSTRSAGERVLHCSQINYYILNGSPIYVRGRFITRNFPYVSFFRDFLFDFLIFWCLFDFFLTFWFFCDILIFCVIFSNGVLFSVNYPSLCPDHVSWSLQGFVILFEFSQFLTQTTRFWPFK